MKEYFLICFLLYASCGYGTEKARTDGSSTELPAAVASSSRAAESPVPGDRKVVWNGKADGFNLEWDGSDLFAQVAGVRQGDGLFSRIAREQCEAKQKGPDKNCYCAHAIRLVSVVGKVISIEDESEFSCAGSYTGWRFASLHLTQAGGFGDPNTTEVAATPPTKQPARNRIISLTKWFSEADLLSALLAEPLISEGVSKAIQQKRVADSPKSLKELNAYLAKSDSTFLDNSFYVEKDYLTRFTFHHLEAEKIAVWISLTPTSHAGQAVRKHLEILLPIPDALRQPLDLASSQKEGFLMKDAATVVGTSYAEFEFMPSR